MNWTPPEPRVGSKYQKGIYTKEIAGLVRADIKAAVKAGELPKGTRATVKTDYYAGGSSIDIYLRAIGTESLQTPEYIAWHNERERLRDWKMQDGTRPEQYTENTKKVLKALNDLLRAYHYDASDSMVDYYCVNFAAHVRIASKGVEESKLAQHHASCASGIENALENSIFSDDPDAVEALEAKIAKEEAQHARDKAINAVIRKHKKAGPEAQVAALVALGLSEGLAKQLLEPDFAGRIGIPSYVSTNRSANIRRMKQRVEEVKVRQARTTAAEAAPNGVLIEGTGDYVRVTFPEKPERETLEALRAAGFHWGGGSWTGRRDKLPEGIA